MTRQTSIQLTPATEAQVAALKAAGFGTFTEIVRIAIDRMAQQEDKTPQPDKSTKWLVCMHDGNGWILDDDVYHGENGGWDTCEHCENLGGFAMKNPPFPVSGDTGYVYATDGTYYLEGRSWREGERVDTLTLWRTHPLRRARIVGWVERCMDGTHWRAGTPKQYDPETDSDAKDLGEYAGVLGAFDALWLDRDTLIEI